MSGENVPGTQVEEFSSLSLAVTSSSTAVPVFIGSFYNTLGAQFSENNSNSLELIRVENWLDFTQKFGVCNKQALYPTYNEITATPKKDKFEISGSVLGMGSIYDLQQTVNYWFDYDGYYNLQLYFINGGGPCYIYPVRIKGGITDNSTDLDEVAKNAAMAIEATPEITLAVMCVGRDREASGLRLIKNPILAKCFLDNNIFVIAGVSEGEIFDRSSLTSKEQTAVYAPFFELSATFTPPASFFDDVIIVSVAADNLSRVTLKTLNKGTATAGHKKLYAQIHEIIDAHRIPVLTSAAAAMAGVYCQTDQKHGIWKAPANVVLKGVAGLCNANFKPVKVTDTASETYLKMGVNAIRHFTARGLVAWGSRTAAEPAAKDWLYIPVRRLFNMAERDIREMMAAAVFEPNTQATWEVVRGAIDSYLHAIWQRGGLAGDSPDKAWRVQVGTGISMSQEDIDQGIMRIRVGMAAVRPAEFIVLEFSQKTATAA